MDAATAPSMSGESINLVDDLRKLRDERLSGNMISLHQPRGALATIGGALSAAGGGGDSTNVTQAFQPSGRLALSNSP
jgi:hypothetical protein